MSQFLSMGGYGGYVWSSFAIFAIVLALDAVAPLLKRRRVLRDLRGRARRAQKRSEETA
ncbi:heme exporter protein CcmD [Tahibacter caeni]|uniref:heme exporter protein CcmD n=1 Tax=Tahibacter caeni TaxID=1453545 RepID=UPI002148F56A|nr:heme exporter protein CcmD [Tahibacter caeni]